MTTTRSVAAAAKRNRVLPGWTAQNETLSLTSHVVAPTDDCTTQEHGMSLTQQEIEDAITEYETRIHDLEAQLQDFDYDELQSEITSLEDHWADALSRIERDIEEAHYMAENADGQSYGAQEDAREAQRGVDDLEEAIGSLDPLIDAMSNKHTRINVADIGRELNRLRHIENNLTRVNDSMERIADALEKMSFNSSPLMGDGGYAGTPGIETILDGFEQMLAEGGDELQHIGYREADAAYTAILALDWFKNDGYETCKRIEHIEEQLAARVGGDPDEDVVHRG